MLVYPMKFISDYRKLIIVWLAWAVAVLIIVQIAPMIFPPSGPDTSLPWTEYETGPDHAQYDPYLTNDFMNGHVAWDSEYYLSIATNGYNDPEMRAVPDNFNWDRPRLQKMKVEPHWNSLNYAFYPAYPAAIRIVMTPFTLFMNAISAATIAGILVSLVGGFFAMLGIYRLGKQLFDENAGFRAALYVLIAPAAMFMAVIYTEGMFLGLSFMALSFGKEKKYIPAGILAFVAAFTKAAGNILLLPLFIYWYKDNELALDPMNPHTFGKLTKLEPKQYLNLLFVGAPALAYLIFKFTMSDTFHIVESAYFARNLLALGDSLSGWMTAISRMSWNPESLLYYSIEIAVMLIAIISLIWMFKKDRALFWYGVCIFIFSFSSGVAQGMHRYALALPSLFLLPAAIGKNKVLNIGWIALNVPFFILLLAKFSFNHWAG